MYATVAPAIDTNPVTIDPGELLQERHARQLVAHVDIGDAFVNLSPEGATAIGCPAIVEGEHPKPLLTQINHEGRQHAEAVDHPLHPGTAVDRHHDRISLPRFAFERIDEESIELGSILRLYGHPLGFR